MVFDRLAELLSEEDFSMLKSVLSGMPPADIAEFLEHIDDKQAIVVFRLLSGDHAVDVFGHLPPGKQATIFGLSNENELTEVVQDLSFDDKIDFLDEMPPTVVENILQHSSETERKLITQFLEYPDSSAGGLMTIEFVDLDKTMTVAQAFDKIRAAAPNKETISTCYCLDPYRKLEGAVSLRDLVLASPEDTIEDIMYKEVLAVNTHEDQEQIAALFRQYDLLSLPVVDHENRLVGIITVDDVVDVFVKEDTEDFYLMAAVHGEAKWDSLLQVSIPTAIRLRLPWLIISLLGGIVAGGVIQVFEEALTSVIVLALFIPVIMNMGGGVGIQTSTIVIRGLATGHINKRNLWQCLTREVLIGMSIGVCCGVVIGLAGQAWQGVPMLGVAVGAAMIAAMTVASFLGAFLPVISSRIGVDPAVISGPLITTIKDVTGLAIYFSVASLVMRI